LGKNGEKPRTRTVYRGEGGTGQDKKHGTAQKTRHTPGKVKKKRPNHALQTGEKGTESLPRQEEKKGWAEASNQKVKNSRAEKGMEPLIPSNKKRAGGKGIETSGHGAALHLVEAKKGTLKEKLYG